MTITILHLYYDLMNLYGENGNVKAIKNYLEQQGIDVIIKICSIQEKINLKNIDLIYIGSSTEENEIKALNHLNQNKEIIEEYIKENKYVLATGNSMELFGKHILYNGKKYKGLSLFNYDTEIKDKRIVDECIAKTDKIDELIIGFTNHSGIVSNIKNPLFKMEKGRGSNEQVDGINEYNFYGTHMIGPIMVRNPKFLEYFTNKLINSKNKNYKIKKANLKLEEEAYKKYISKYENELTTI